MLSLLSGPSDVDNIDQIREKYNACNIKLSEYRNHIQELKQELKVANKVGNFIIGIVSIIHVNANVNIHHSGF